MLYYLAVDLVFTYNGKGYERIRRETYISLSSKLYLKCNADISKSVITIIALASVAFISAQPA